VLAAAHLGYVNAPSTLKMSKAYGPDRGKRWSTAADVILGRLLRFIAAQVINP
jgi:hypothetical protein